MRSAGRMAGVLAACGLLAGACAAAPVRLEFNRPFAPSEGRVAPPERPLRDEICLNGRWQFEPVAVPETYKPNSGVAPELPPPTAGGWSATTIKIPSPWNVNGFNRGPGGDFRAYPSYPKAWEDVQMAWMRRQVDVPARWKGTRVLLTFNAIAGQAVVLVNGKRVGESFDLFLPATFDVTDAVQFGTRNEVRVGVRKASLFDGKGETGARPYPGGSMWGQWIAGIWQDAFLDSVPAVRVADTYVVPRVGAGVLAVRVTLRNDTPRPTAVRVGAEASPWVNLAGKSVLDAPVPRWKLGPPALSLPARAVTVPAGREVTVSLEQPVKGRLKLWSPDAPNLYGLVVTVSANGKGLDRQYTRFGWREFAVQGNRHLLNGKPLELRGDSWHFMGVPQMTRRYAWAWCRLLKDHHANAVRLHAQPYPSFYLDVADEMGICVLDETANWDSDAGHKYEAPEFWQRSDDHLRRLIMRDRNHASVFGWSVSNEVAWFIRDSRPALMKRLDQAWRDWLAEARRLDPSRPWVSTDGDNDADGIMPTSVSHYTGARDIVRNDKPFGEGETGGAYYASPKYAASFIGPSAYASQKERMEGLAVEAYALIKEQRQVKACYASVFNLVWYGLEPLPFGLRDATRPPAAEDGVFFATFREGTPGVQPERLGPYCSTLNPGYDPAMPLYRPWALADAIKAAYAPDGPAPSPWDHRPAEAGAAATGAAAVPGKVVVLADAGSLLPDTLRACGADVADASALGAAPFIVIDGAAPPAADPVLSAAVAKRVAAGATCFVLGGDPATVARLNALLPAPVRLTVRAASSLVVTRAAPLLAGVTNADLYFSETVTGDVMRHGLAGAFTDGGMALAEACRTDWRQWNGVAEPIKTGATIRSEREAKAAGAALVERREGAGRYVMTTLDLAGHPTDLLPLVMRLMANAGMRFEAAATAGNTALDVTGKLHRVLACGAFPADSREALYGADNVGVATVRPKAGDRAGECAWTPLSAGEGGVFNLKQAGLPGTRDNVVAYLSFWVWSPRPLDNLLVEPNMPRVDLLMGSDDGCQIWLNGKLIKEDRGVHPVTADEIVAGAIPLQRGWNHVVAKVVQEAGEWGFAARLRSSDPRFLLQLRSSTTPPE